MKKVHPKKVFLSKIAIVNLILSATETYKHEALGLIFGKVYQDTLMIKNIIGYQTAKRKFTEVSDSKKSIFIKKFLDNNTRLVGDFHSHTDYKGKTHAKISNQDIKDMQPGETSLIIGLAQLKIRRASIPKNRENDGKGISFSTNGFKYHIRCYYKTEDRKLKELKVSTKYFKALKLSS
ncbi:MAG: Mov34/MPN/PAD-1 family protein [Nanoarchaeota archaeon]|nr:Mov34/MPN/PAD-1 family protein [Nanoarchaeota archaeon]MCG2717923.1 Mov34/MPN/PAD-1 family protein [Nanoarchaeota archaeon]